MSLRPNPYPPPRARYPAAPPKLRPEDAEVLGEAFAAANEAKRVAALVEGRPAALRAVKRNGRAIVDNDAYYYSDREYMLAAIATWPPAYLYADAALRSHEGFAIAAVKNNGLALKHAIRFATVSVDLVMAAVTENGMALEFAPPVFLRYDGVVRRAVSRDGMALQFADESMKANRDIVAAAASNNGDSLAFAPTQFEKSPRLRLLASHTSPAYAVAVLSAMKEDLEERDRRTLRAKVRAFRESRTGRKIFGFDTLRTAAGSYAKVAEYLAKIWAEPERIKRSQGRGNDAFLPGIQTLATQVKDAVTARRAKKAPTRIGEPAVGDELDLSAETGCCGSDLDSDFEFDESDVEIADTAACHHVGSKKYSSDTSDDEDT
jgi:hypothetical protein